MLFKEALSGKKEREKREKREREIEQRENREEREKERERECPMEHSRSDESALTAPCNACKQQQSSTVPSLNVDLDPGGYLEDIVVSSV